MQETTETTLASLGLYAMFPNKKLRAIFSFQLLPLNGYLGYRYPYVLKISILHLNYFLLRPRSPSSTCYTRTLR